jgi:hypothetical protein
MQPKVLKQFIEADTLWYEAKLHRLVASHHVHRVGEFTLAVGADEVELAWAKWNLSIELRFQLRDHPPGLDRDLVHRTEGESIGLEQIVGVGKCDSCRLSERVISADLGAFLLGLGRRSNFFSNVGFCE